MEQVKIKLNDEVYYLNKEYLVKELKDTVLEKEIYVRTSYNLNKDLESTDLLTLAKKGDIIMGFIVAVDGPASSGKGTITKIVAEKLNLVSIDTGAMYRCVTLDMINKGINLDEIGEIEKVLEDIKIELKREGDTQKVYLNREDVTLEIRTQKVNALVSQVSHIPVVRQAMVELQRKMGESQDVIMEGRDIGTNVFPNADVKIYLDASAEERAKRRMKQNEENGINVPYEEILESIKFRDNNDKTSNVAPLKQAEDAVYLDSTPLTIEQVVERMIQIIKEVKK